MVQGHVPTTGGSLPIDSARWFWRGLAVTHVSRRLLTEAGILCCRQVERFTRSSWASTAGCGLGLARELCATHSSRTTNNVRNQPALRACTVKPQQPRELHRNLRNQEMGGPPGTTRNAATQCARIRRQRRVAPECLPLGPALVANGRVSCEVRGGSKTGETRSVRQANAISRVCMPRLRSRIATAVW